MMGLITDDEVRRIVLGACYEAKKNGREGGVPESEIVELVAWAERVRIDAGVLANVLDGSMHVTLIDGKPAFVLSPKGMEEAKRLVAEARQ
jgi:hypothetical protein